MLLSMSISQFEASEKLTGLAFGTSYQKAPFSTLFDHVKDDAIRLDQTEHLLQTAARRAHEANVKAKDGKPPLAASSTSTPSNPKVFLGRDGKKHAYLIPPDAFKKITQAERKAELIRLKAARDYQVDEHTATTVVSGNTASTSSLPASAAGTPIAMNISYSDAVNSGANLSVSSNLWPPPSVISHQSGYPGTPPVPPLSPAGLKISSVRFFPPTSPFLLLLLLVPNIPRTVLSTLMVVSTAKSTPILFSMTSPGMRPLCLSALSWTVVPTEA
jgi:hypothetical protein